MELMLRPNVLLVLAVLCATSAFAWNVRRRRASGRLLLAGSAALFCGTLSAALVSVHVVIFIVTRAAQRSEVTAQIAWAKKFVVAGVPYDMRLYSVLLLAAVILVPAIRCIRESSSVVLGAEEGWNAAVRSSLMLMIIAGPLIPLQEFAPFIAVGAFVTLETAFFARPDLTVFANSRPRRQELTTAEITDFNSVRAS